MSVVTRGLMAAGMAIYAAMHLGQVLIGTAVSAVWADVGFALTAVLAAGLAIALVVAEDRRIEHAAALLAGVSMITLVVTHTVGLFGVDAGSLIPSALLVIVAEAFVLVAWGIEQFAPSVGHVSRTSLEDPHPNAS